MFQNGGVAILLSALSALYQMTFAGFFVNLNDIPAVLRWLQWLAPLKYTLEALSVNEVDSGLQIQDTLEGVPVNVSAALIMQLVSAFVSKGSLRTMLIAESSCLALVSITIIETYSFCLDSLLRLGSVLLVSCGSLSENGGEKFRRFGRHSFNLF